MAAAHLLRPPGMPVKAPAAHLNRLPLEQQPPTDTSPTHLTHPPTRHPPHLLCSHAIAALNADEGGDGSREQAAAGALGLAQQGGPREAAARILGILPIGCRRQGSGKLEVG